MSGERQYDRCAYESSIRDLGQENSTLRAAFRTAFFEAMRSELTARQYEVLRLETVEGMNGKEAAARAEVRKSGTRPDFLGEFYAAHCGAPVLHVPALPEYGRR